MTQPSAKKVCKECGKRKSLALFDKNSHMTDNRLNTCSKCAIKIRALNYKSKIPEMRAYAVAYKVNNPEKIKAHNLVRSAKRNGSLLPKPCQECGSEKTQAHHSDYSKPLDVMWLCQSHHKLLHMELNKNDTTIS